MKKILIYIAVFGVILTSAYAYSGATVQYRDWITDFYNHGVAGYDCEDIFDNNGIRGRTFNKENSKFTMQFINACRTGSKDAATGQSSLAQLLDEWDSSNGGE